MPEILHKYFEPFFLRGEKPVPTPEGVVVGTVVWDIKLTTAKKFEDLDTEFEVRAFLQQHPKAEDYLNWQSQKKIEAWKEGHGQNFFGGSTNALVSSLEDALSLEKANNDFAGYSDRKARFDSMVLAAQDYRLEHLEAGIVGGPSFRADAEYIRLQN